MRSKKTGLTSAETEILEMVHSLYGKRHHRWQECFSNEERENLIFIKNRHGEAQFAVNLTLLAKIRTIFTVQFQEKYLLKGIEFDNLLPTCGQNPLDEYHAFISEQLQAPAEDEYESLAS